MNIEQYPTPRTDKEVKLVGMLREHLVGVGLCRDLERELAAMTAERDEVKVNHSAASAAHAFDHNGISAIALEMFGRNDIGYTDSIRAIQQLRVELTEARAQNAALRDALGKVELWYAAENIHSEHWKNARAILAATEPKETK